MPEHPKLAYTRATLAAPPDPDGDDPIEFVASQKRKNRYGFALRPDGWLLDNFRANPVFLWMHNPGQPPIGRVNARQEAGELRAGVTFDRDDDLATTVERKYRAGFLNAVSVGWGFVREDGTPILDWWRLKPEEIASKDVFYDLEEISGVSVPGDPRAVRKQSRQALARLGRELLDLFDTPEPDPDEVAAVVRGQVDEALAAALGRLGIALPNPSGTAPAGSGNLATATLNVPTAEAAGGILEPPADPDPAVDSTPAGGEPAALFDPSAAQDFLAALALERG
jgi:hypothetical protein